MPAPAHSPPSPDLHPSKRPRPSSPDKDSPVSPPSGGAGSPTDEHHLQDGALLPAGHGGGAAGGAGKVGQSSSFRNVSACNRCRLRKNRCDQKLPSCASCEKASVACVGYDPITKREIPRSYIFYLETRVEQLEALLSSNNIAFPPAENLEYCSKRGNGASSTVRSPTEAGNSSISDVTEAASSAKTGAEGGQGDDTNRLQKLVTKSGFSGIPGAANPRFLGSASGVSFARVVFAAVQSSVSDQRSTSSEKGGVRPYKSIAGNGPAATGAGAGLGMGGASMRDSFFGLHTKPSIHPAPFPDKSVSTKLVTLYFEHANPQIPVLHKGEFMDMFELAYAETGRVRGPRELYVLNMVFAIGGGIIYGDGKNEDSSQEPKQSQPEEYHASAIVHLEACLGSGGGLEELQAVLLLANFALLRPVPPGLWYIIGVAVRLAVDLGLHYEDGKDVETGLGDAATQQNETLARERGRREYIRDLRRRLWWCTYSFDRLVSVCVGRPFGISDQVITTEFPSLLEDRYISQSGLREPPSEMLKPTYKLVAHHYFRLRLLQSEILQVLQFQQAQIARAGGLNQRNPHMHTSLPSPFLSQFDSFRSWRIDIDKRLYGWKNSAPKKNDTGVAFSTEFFDLNYWQAIIMLYRQSLSVPAMFEGEYHTAKEVNSPTIYNMELREDEDRVYLKVAEAGQKILRLYRQLHLVGLVNYTYLATHHLFVAGISYLYAIWHSPIVRSRLTMDEVDFTVLAATSVFTDLMEKCPPAEACRDAFDRTVKATIKMTNSTGGFGQTLPGQGSSRNSIDHRHHHSHQQLDWGSRSDGGVSSSLSSRRPHRASIEHGSSRAPQLSDLASASASDSYANSASPTSQLGVFQKTQRFRLKTESDGFSHMRNLPPQPRSNASSDHNTNINNPGTPEAGSAIDPSLMGSPTMAQARSAMSSPAAGFQPQQQPQQAYSPAAMGYNDLQGMEFLQGLESAGSGLDGAGDFAMMDTQVDLGFGFGWEGLHHDFSDGQQVDLFDGFFFGGQQIGNGGVGGGGGNGL
ncbi:fungal-specific transcription factor domain-containing protein [Lasiosphaeris hirsuta]|uniref:Fungal-specific transcription factor domain-containing protein n=1 Tax=Lasiosphaeris hirsuta TaxID=260670 RepID=A0AA40DTL8_9PEZI|nr:fungal-specific transcription factor domain-containing protein [Lasiosphaeris hirsuta]